jgi:TadE-like protein
MLTRNGERGQSLVEFALVFPIFILMFFGLVDGARLVYTNSQLGQAAREGARVAAVESSNMGSTDLACVSSESQITAARPGAHVCPADPTALKADVVSAVNRMAVGLGAIATVYLACDSGGAADPGPPSIPADPAPTGAWTEATVTYPACANDSSDNAAPNAAGSLVSVRIVYTYNPITPIAGSLIGSVSLSASATMVIN